MASRPKQPQPRPAPRLYLVTPAIGEDAGFSSKLKSALESADVAAVLLRLAEGDERSLVNRVKQLAPNAQDKGVALLLDGHENLVAPSGADGAHLTGVDAFTAALETLKPERIAGAGGLGSRHDAMIAAEAGADYLMFGDAPGANFAALEERISWAAEIFEVPCVAFAASAGEVAPLVAAGADFIALDFIWTEPRGAAAALGSLSADLRVPEPVR